MQNRWVKKAMVLAGLLACFGAAADSLTEALTNSKLSGDLRLRYETVDVDSPTVKDATALTLRTRLGITTAPLAGFNAVVEFSDTHVVAGVSDFSPQDKDPAKPANNPYTYAPVVDPEMTKLDRAFLHYNGSGFDLGLGRQRLIYDNARFIGNVGWRQNEQTFDAFTAGYSGLKDWTFTYAYVDRVNGIAEVKPVYNFNADTSDNLFNVAYSGFSFGKITAYAYLLQNDEPDANLLNTGATNNLNAGLRYQSNDTYGARFDGAYMLQSAGVKLLYTAEYAKQKLKNAVGTEFDTKYSLLEAGVSVGPAVAKVAQEVLGSDNGLQGFQTPYATKHAFNGWVDMFLATPASGLKDRYATLIGSFPYAVKAMAVYHKFSKDEGSGDFGNEIDVQVTKQFGKNYTLGVKYGDFSADSDSGLTDTKKFWLWGELTF